MPHLEPARVRLSRGWARTYGSGSQAGMKTIHALRGLGLAALLAAMAAPAAAQAPKPAAKAAPKPAAASAFDARDPAGLISVLAEMEAKAVVARTTEDAVFLNVTTPAFGFGVQFAGCNAQGKACQAMAFSTAAEKKSATLAQLNSFNQTSINCRTFQDRGGKPHVSYSALLSARDNRDEMKMHVGAWQGCLATFGEFLNDPIGFLAKAP